MLDKIDWYCRNTLSIVKIVKKIFISYIFKGPVDGEMNCYMYTEWLGQIEATEYRSHPIMLKPEILQWVVCFKIIWHVMKKITE